jgi:hypothetical protein
MSIKELIKGCPRMLFYFFVSHRQIELNSQHGLVTNNGLTFIKSTGTAWNCNVKGNKSFQIRVHTT